VLGSLVRWEWLLFEALVLGWAVWELVSLRKYRDQDRAAKKPSPPPDA